MAFRQEIPPKPMQKEDVETASILDVLSPSVIHDAIVPRVLEASLQSAARFAKVCSQARGFFAEGLMKARRASYLLQYVIDHQCEAAAAMAQEEPALMFIHTKARDLDGNEIEISPLKYVLKTYHKIMFDVFCNAASDHAEQFLKHAGEQQEGITFNELSNAYATSNEMIDNWHKGNVHEEDSIRTCELIKAGWRERVGGALSRIPRHFLEQMMIEDPHGEAYWSVENQTFHRTLSAASWQINFMLSGPYQTTDLLVVNGARLGNDFAYYRASSPLAICTDGRMMFNGANDERVFLHLLDVRRRQIIDALNDMRIRFQASITLRQWN